MENNNTENNIIENNQFENFEQMPNEFLNEISENEFLSETTNLSEKKEEKKEEPAADFFSLNDTPNAAPQQGATNVNLEGLIDEKIAIELFDTIAVAILIYLCSQIDLGIDKKEFMLSASEKKTISPIVKECLKKINFNFTNPFEALAFVSLVIYGSKVAPHFDKVTNKIQEKISGKKAPEKKKENVKKEGTEKVEKESGEPSKYLIEKYGLEEAKLIMKNKGK